MNFLRSTFLIMFPLFFCSTSFAESRLSHYFKLKSEGWHSNAKSALNTWSAKSFEEESYRKFFLAVNEDKVGLFWDLYQDLSKKRKLLKLQHESIKRILELETESPKSLTKGLKNFPKVAKQMLKNMRAQPEGLEYELLYLKWILKTKNLKELCRNERTRWLSQTTLSLSEVIQGLEACPVDFDDIVFRTRSLIFSGEEKKAQVEISEFTDLKKLKDWEKAYLQAVYFTNVGDPVSAFQAIIPFQEELKKSSSYYDNLFFIAQRAGELGKAEEIINHIIEKSGTQREKKEFSYQKAFLFYQTRRYKEANEIFSVLIRTHSSHHRQTKSREYDELTWLRAWCYYLDKDFEKARQALQENRIWARDKARNLYWLAQTEWALDDQVTALAHYRQLALPVIEGKIFSYYNYLAWLRFESYKSFVTTDMLRAQMDSLKSGRGNYYLPDVTTNPLKLLAEYKSYFEDLGATDEGNIQVMNDLASDADETAGLKTHTSTELKSELAWADELIKWGHRDLAKWHLYEIEKNLSSRAESEPLIQYYLDSQYYYRALSLANQTIPLSGRKLSLSEDSLLWKALFPKAYEKTVEEEADRRDIPSYLIWSIMKAETQYKQDAISPVGAMGLMQFMPYTAQKVALLIGEEYKPDQLFEPGAAIRYGAAYLKKLSNELGAQLPLIAAAYNGGPHRVKLWLKNFKEKDDTNMNYDVFIEHIPFNETRTYVKRVLSFFLAYQKLYGDRLDFKKTKWIVEKNPFVLKDQVSLKEEWPLDKK